jgi:SAM-dependent methyltransferase
MLSRPGPYLLFQRLLRRRSARPRFVKDHLRPQPGDRILDLGSGPGELVRYLPDVRYVGVDVNPDYVVAARKRYGDRAEFHCLDARRADFPDREFELVSAIGLLHHLDDEGVESVFRLGSRVLARSGRMITLDNTLAEGQGRIARWLVAHDRGAWARPTSEYVRLAEPFFEDVVPVVREDLLRVPYTHAILECAGPKPSGPTKPAAA